MEKLLNNFQLLNIIPRPPSRIPYGIVMLGAELEWKEVLMGANIKVAVLDTGRPQHKDIKVMESANFTPDNDGIDGNGHSTHVCGTICANGELMGVLPLAKLYTAKVLTNQGFGSDSMVAAGIDWAVSKGVDVINMSLGGQNPQPLTHEAIKKAVNQGVVIVCAAGNAGESWMAYPAKFAETIAAAAVNIDKQWADFSSVGDEVEVCAAGVDVLSCWLNNQYAYLRGTSMASPHIAAVIGILQAKAVIRYGRKLTLPEIRLLLHIYAEDIGKFGKDQYHGYGLFSFGRIKESEVIDHEVKMEIGNKIYWVDGQPRKMDVAPEIKDGRAMVPVRFVAEGLGKTVGWIPPKTVVIK